MGDYKGFNLIDVEADDRYVMYAYCKVEGNEWATGQNMAELKEYVDRYLVNRTEADVEYVNGLMANDKVTEWVKEFVQWQEEGAQCSGGDIEALTKEQTMEMLKEMFLCMKYDKEHGMPEGFECYDGDAESGPCEPSFYGVPYDFREWCLFDSIAK